MITQRDLEHLPNPIRYDCDGWNWLIGCRCWDCRVIHRSFCDGRGKASYQLRIKHLKTVIRLLQLRRDR